MRDPMDTLPRGSPLALSALALLVVGPLHPYGMRRLLKEWGKDSVINVGNPANLYKTIKRLHDAGMIDVRHTERDHLYPERTVYELTDAGRHTVTAWLEDMVSSPRGEFPEFPAALSFAMLLAPEDLLQALERRATRLAEEIRAITQTMESHAGSLPRVTLLDDEYRGAVKNAELTWIRNVIDDLRSGSLTWSEELGEAARAFVEGDE